MTYPKIIEEAIEEAETFEEATEAIRKIFQNFQKGGRTRKPTDKEKARWQREIDQLDITPLKNQRGLLSGNIYRKQIQKLGQRTIIESTEATNLQEAERIITDTPLRQLTKTQRNVLLRRRNLFDSASDPDRFLSAHVFRIQNPIRRLQQVFEVTEAQARIALKNAVLSSSEGRREAVLRNRERFLAELGFSPSEIKNILI